MKIRTAYKTNANGTGQIVAKGHGRQRTVTYNHEWSSDRNHGNAAGTLALTFDVTNADDASHTDNGDGTHLFIL